MSQQDDIKEWFLKEFWPVYPARFCSRKDKGSRAISLKHMLKHKPGAEERKRILANLKAQIRAHQKKPEDQQKYWKNGETYCYNGLWDDEIDSMMEVKQETEKKYCHCGEQTIGPGFTVCEKHTESHAARLKMMSILKEIGCAKPGQSLQELSQSCREYLQTRGGFGRLYEGMTSSEKPVNSGNQ